MTRKAKYVLYLAFLLMIVLVIVLAAQLRTLQQQWRSSVRLIPADSKIREDGAPGQFDRDAEVSSGRPEVMVKFRTGISEDTINQIAGRFSDHLRDEIEAVPGLVALDDPDNADALAIVAQYQALPEVEYAEPNYEISLEQTKPGERQVPLNDPGFSDQWSLSKINAWQAWSRTRGSDQIVVAILDTGVEYTHVDLLNRIWTRPADMKPYQDRDLGTFDDIHGYNVLGNDGDPLDDNGHGTNCAGIIAADCANNLGICGINWQTQIMPLKFLNAGGFGNVLGAIEAINYAIDRKLAGVNLRVITVSWGLSQHSRALEEVIRKASQVGILFVAAAGSSNSDNDRHPYYPASYNLENVISVAATDRNDALAKFSNFGAKSVQIAAPGEDILTTALGNENERRSGAPMAAAVASGVAALAVSAQPDLSVAQLHSLLLNSVDKVPGLRGKVSTQGRINAAKAVGNN